jgi:hypothetical protein
VFLTAGLGVSAGKNLDGAGRISGRGLAEGPAEICRSTVGSVALAVFRQAGAMWLDELAWRWFWNFVGDSANRLTVSGFSARGRWPIFRQLGELVWPVRVWQL